jgi:histidine triad (HIT) family protein
MAEANCLFCKIAAGTIPANKVYEDEQALAFRDINPQAPTHILLIPKAHLTSLNETTANDEALLGSLLRLVPQLAQQEGLTANGYRTVINTGADGGQTVFHLHLHLLGGRPLTWPPG